MQYNKKIRKIIQGGDFHRLFKKKLLTVYVNEEKHLPYYQIINKKYKVVTVPQTGSRSSPIHHNRDIYLYNMNCYEMEKTSTVTP